jgi:hypothetical protein
VFTTTKVKNHSARKGKGGAALEAGSTLAGTTQTITTQENNSDENLITTHASKKGDDE